MKRTLAFCIAFLHVEMALAEIKDNSFFIEEAYNQEAGVVQHIFNWLPQWDAGPLGTARTFSFLYTNEIPLGGEDNQFSYQIPLLSFAVDPIVGPSVDEAGIGDIQFNYRRQIWKEEEVGVAFAPRASVIIPSGDRSRGLGSGVVGYQFNLPFSKQLEDFAVHFNAGLTTYPGVRGLVRTFDLTGYNLGASVIYTANDKFQPLCEFIFLWNASLNDTGLGVLRPFQAIVSPGFRFQVYQEGETQLVAGLACPIGVSQEAPNIGAFFYFSFERKSPVLAWLKGDCGCQDTACAACGN